MPVLRLVVFVCFVASFAAAAHAGSRYYLLRTDYQWEMFATQDDATLDGTDDGSLVELPIRICDPLTMTLVMRVDDANMPGRRGRVTFWFKSIRYQDDQRHWTLEDFEDADFLRHRARAFLAQRRLMVGVPTVLAYEEEALGVILALAHGRSFLMDFDVTPDRPDPLIYQADALIASIVSDEPGEPIDEKYGVAWLESDSAVRELRDRVLDSDIQRVERIRQLLWHHLKSLAFFAENHQYDTFNPGPLGGDAPWIYQALPTTTGQDTIARRTAGLSSRTPAFGFPALYRWASLREVDFAAAVAESDWHWRDGEPAAGGVNPTDADPKTRGYAQRLQATRQSLAESGDWRDETNRDRLLNALRRRHDLGERYVNTLISLHRHFKRTGSDAAVVDADPGRFWYAKFPVEQPAIVLDAEGNTLRTNPAGEHGLWFTALENVRFDVDDRVRPADRLRIAERKLTVASNGDDIPLYVPALLSDESGARLAIVSFEALSTLEGDRVTKKKAEELLKQWAESDQVAAATQGP